MSGSASSYATLQNPNSSIGGVYSGSAGTGIFSNEICLCLLNQLEDRASSWLEGLLKAASTPNKENGDHPNTDEVQKVFNEGLDMVNNWTPTTLKQEVEALTQNCPNIREIYRAVIEIYVASYFQLYPQMSYDISAPNLSIFVHCYYRFLARDSSVRMMKIFQMFGDQRRFIYERATRNALYHILKRPMQEIFASLENIQAESSRKQRATPSENAIDPPTLINPNRMFQQVVHNCMQDVSTPAQSVAALGKKQDTKTPNSRKHREPSSSRGNSSRKSNKHSDYSPSSSTSSSKSSFRRSSRSSSRRSSKDPSKNSSRHYKEDNAEPIIPLSVPVLPSQRSVSSSKGTVQSHRTIALPTPNSKQQKSRKTRKRNDSYDSYSSEELSDEFLSSGSETESESESEGYSSDEDQKSRKHRRKGKERERRHHRDHSGKSRYR